MILVIGGLGAGKKQFVTEVLGYTEDDLTRTLNDDKRVLIDLHELLRTTDNVDEAFVAALLAKEVVVCNEVGSGVVPLDADERLWRDEVGRVSARIAKDAEVVVRLVCGIPQIIKGAL